MAMAFVIIVMSVWIGIGYWLAQAMNFYEFNKKLTKTFGDFYILAKDKKPCAVCRNLTNTKH